MTMADLLALLAQQPDLFALLMHHPIKTLELADPTYTAPILHWGFR